MQQMSNQTLLIFFLILGILLVYLLAPIMTPFLLGALLAYLCDPLVKRLEKKHIPHLLSVIIVFSLLIVIVLLIVLTLVPLVRIQILTLVDLLPQIVTWMQDNIMPWLREMMNPANIKTAMTGALSKADAVVSTVVASGYVIAEWTINLILTPVVTFYLLRDWDKVCVNCTSIWPKHVRPTLDYLLNQMDAVLSGFFRGQLLVMVSLCIIYGVGLTMVGLKVGLMIGIIGGLLSIVPYLGSFFVVVASTVMGIVQFHDIHNLVWIWLVFLIGQAIESYILTPYFVGERIGLHPVVVIFAILAGGVLFGFFGVLLALPIAAVIKVFGMYVKKHGFTLLAEKA